MSALRGAHSLARNIVNEPPKSRPCMPETDGSCGLLEQTAQWTGKVSCKEIALGFLHWGFEESRGHPRDKRWLKLCSTTKIPGKAQGHRLHKPV